MAIIELSKRQSSVVDPTTEKASHRLQVWVSKATEGIEPQLFVYQKVPPVPGTTEEQLEEIFVHIASYADILDFPIDTVGEDTPFFRKYSIDLTFESLAVLNQKWSMMKAMINATVEDVVRLNNLPATSLEELDVGPCA
jgi:hypothetical protein